jgi:LPS-assembly lipoprotein
MQLLALLLSALMLSSCGFHLHGQTGMPFNTLYLDAANPNTPFITELQRNLETKQVRLVNTAKDADVVLQIVYESFNKQILTLGSSGRVNGFRLNYRVSLRAYDLNHQEWIPAEEMEQHRDYSYDDSIILAKEAEESLLVQSMRSDVAQQIVRRLSRAKPQAQ